MKLKLQTRRLCLALAAAAVLAGGWLAIQAAPKPQAADTPAVQTAASAAAPVRTIGYTLVPLSLYFKGPRVKVEVGLCKGKKLYDKRDAAAKKDAKREMDRALKMQRR